MVGVPQSGGLQIVSTYPGGPATQFYSLRETESNPGPKPTLKTLSHTRTQPPTLTKYTRSSVQPAQTSPPSLSLAYSPPKHPHLSKTPTLAPYTLDRIQPTRPVSPHIFPSHKLPPTAPIPVLHIPTPTHETNKRPPKQTAKR